MTIITADNRACVRCCTNEGDLIPRDCVWVCPGCDAAIDAENAAVDRYYCHLRTNYPPPSWIDGAGRYHVDLRLHRAPVVPIRAPKKIRFVGGGGGGRRRITDAEIKFFEERYESERLEALDRDLGRAGVL